jgi:hypothetical protein
LLELLKKIIRPEMSHSGEPCRTGCNGLRRLIEERRRGR